jgi:hypothetical protein
MVDFFVNSSAVFSNKDQQWGHLRIWHHRANRRADKNAETSVSPESQLSAHQLAPTEDL